MLQHGSVLIDGTQELARELCRQPADAGTAPASTTLHEQLGRAPSWREVATAVLDGVGTELGTAIVAGELPQAAERLIPALERRYRSHEWTSRR